MDELRSAVRAFWERDYESDVQMLNTGLAKNGAVTAGFEPAPPAVLTGNPFALTPGSCIGVVGLNPKWQPGMDESAEIMAGRGEHSSVQGFDKYVLRRVRYFAEGSVEYYGRYFSKLQNRLAETLLAGQVGKPEFVFRDAAFKIDLLPWWSSDTSLIDEKRATTYLEPIASWKGVMDAFVRTLRPRMIVINGCSMRHLLAVLLDGELRSFSFGPAKHEVAYTGWLADIPVIAHRQLNARGAPSSPDAYRRLIDVWAAMVGIPHPSSVS